MAIFSVDTPVLSNSSDSFYDAALKIIHNFVHEEIDTLKMAPLHNNVECPYLTVVLITRYIAYQPHY